MWSRKFVPDTLFVDWENSLKIDELNVDNSANMYLDKTDLLLDAYASLKRINASWDSSLKHG